MQVSPRRRTIDADVRITVGVSRRVQHLSLLQADGEKGAIVSKQNFCNEFLDGFCVCEEMPKIEETAICLQMDVDAASGSMMDPCWTLLEMGKLPDRDPLCFT